MLEQAGVSGAVAIVVILVVVVLGYAYVRQSRKKSLARYGKFLEIFLENCTICILLKLHLIMSPIYLDTPEKPVTKWMALCTREGRLVNTTTIILV